MRTTITMVLLLAACDDGKDTATEAAAFADVETVISQSCAFSGCHGAGAGGLTLDGADDYDALVSAPSVAVDAILVVPGDADSSYLIEKMEGAATISGDVMPPTGALDQDTIDLVRAWINNGATQ